MKIDIIHATAGEGHRKIAMAVQDGLARESQKGPANLQVRLLNCLDFTDATFQKTYTSIYYWSVRHAPDLWGGSYEALDHAWLYQLIRPLRSLTNTFHAKCSFSIANSNMFIVYFSRQNRSYLTQRPPLPAI